MSNFEDAIASLHLGLFAAFGRAATVARGTDAAVPVTVVLDKESRQVGEYGQAVAIVSLVSFRSAEWQPRSGDVVTVDAVAHRIDTIDADDGYVTVAVLHG